MGKKCQGLAFSLLLIAGTALPAEDKVTASEARQVIEDTTPQQKYNTAKREVQAAYQEALNDCKKMRGSEKTVCTKEAKESRQNDLTEAKKLLGQDVSSGK
jgi:hypothetical protein